MTRSRALFVSPVIPNETGNGLAMRAGTVLRAMSKCADVVLLVVPVYGSSDLSTMPASLISCCACIESVDPSAGNGADTLLPTLTESKFDLIHVFRLSILDYARAYLVLNDAEQRRQLDLDELESVTHLRMARVACSNGDHDLAEHFVRLAYHYFDLEQEALATFDRILVCSERDRATLRARGIARASIDLLPNTIEITRESAPFPKRDPFRLLFVGTLGYFPNEDGIVWFVREVLPLLQQRAGRAFEVEVVGTGHSERLHRLVDSSPITLVGAVPDVAPSYQRASAVVVPLRAGGGTRIKVLEAFAHGRPVVTTPVGIEGIDAVDGEHVLVGFTASAFANHCLRLMQDQALAQRLVENARSLVSVAYAPSRVAAAIDSLFAAPGH